MSTEYPRRLCNQRVKNDDDSTQCDLCGQQSHINCANVSKQTYDKLKNDP